MGKGHPVVRPLFWDFLDDAITHTDNDAVENQITLGGVVLVHGIQKPLVEGGDKASVVLPKSAGWYDLHTGAFSPPGRYDLSLTLESIPAYYLAGTIIPLQSRIRRSSSCMALDPHTLNVYLDPATGSAKGRVYLDDYKTLTYQDGKSFLEVEFVFESGTLKASATRGSLADASVSTEVEKVEVFGLKAAPKGAELELQGVKHEL